MRKPIFALIVLAALTSAAPRAEAKLFRHRGSVPVASYSGGYATSSYGGPASAYPTWSTATQGSDDFTFYGKFYGHPYDPWTWPYMSGSYGRGLARYYDPPVK